MIEGPKSCSGYTLDVLPPRTPAGPVEQDVYALMGAFASAIGTPTCIRDHGSLEA